MLSGLNVAQRILTGYVRPQNWIGYLIFPGRGKLPAAVCNFFILVLKRKRGLSQDQRGVAPKLPRRLRSPALAPPAPGPAALPGPPPRARPPHAALRLISSLCAGAQPSPHQESLAAGLPGSNLSANPQARRNGGPLMVPKFSSFNLPFPTYITNLISGLFIVCLQKHESKFQKAELFAYFVACIISTFANSGMSPVI